MTNKLQGLITLFNERKTFFNNHPDTYRFMREVLGGKISQGTEIEISVKSPDGQKTSTSIKVDDVDMKFVSGLSDILKS